MSKYSSLETAVYSIFASDGWQILDLKAYPSNFITNNTEEYLRITILPASNGVNLNSVEGIILIDIFTIGNSGTKRIYQIADILDDFLLGKVLYTNPDNIQLFGSTLNLKGLDTANASLYRTTYTINFKFFRGN